MPPMAMTPQTAMPQTVVMMVAMMLPSFTPAVWHYYRDLAAVEGRAVVARTVVFVFGYLAVWTAIALAMDRLNDAFPAKAFAPSIVGVTLIVAGSLQCTRWKSKRLTACRGFCPGERARILDGYRYGLECAVSCSPPMAALFVAGLMNPGAMTAVTVAITLERVTTVGPTVARVTGSLAMLTGIVLCARAAGLA